MYNEEVRTTMKFTKFNIFTRDGNKEVTAPRRMTLDEAMVAYIAIGIETILKTLMEVLLSVTQRQKTENVAKEMQKSFQYVVGNINIVIK